MNKKSIFIALALATVTGAIAFAAGVKMGEPQQIASKDADPVKSAPLCNITNQFATEMQVEIIESKFTSGTYYIQPSQKGMFFCGDKVRVINGKYKTELTIKNSTTFQQATPVKNTTNI
jgi:hypothetical protein